MEVKAVAGSKRVTICYRRQVKSHGAGGFTRRSEGGLAQKFKINSCNMADKVNILLQPRFVVLTMDLLTLQEVNQ